MKFGRKEPEPPSLFSQAFDQCQNNAFQAIPGQSSAAGYADTVPMEVVCLKYPEGSHEIAVVDELRLQLARESIVNDMARKLGCVACSVQNKPWEHVAATNPQT
ncbi:MAG TPA: hypothetical protein VHD60_02790 [Candidatus Saccharimonadales bacterium]|nr:hypothetical protein [Candidatus Saccharimonadales bacterium]